ncbi:hypothetical protein CRM22_007664 [Opisthorchis felineus]|nr:hypothetical protein CRM22_007664 [Opisthorchis felineus]
MTEWLALNISTSLNGDPANLRTIQMVQVPSVYDYFVFLHVYASRSTLTMNSIWQSKCDPRQQKLDFAHKGPGFPTWHRAYVLFVEEELGRLNASLTDPFSKRDGDNFALPYWDWTGQTGCSVCTTDLVGAFSPNGQLLDSSPFADWVTFCPQRPEFDDCHVCDPGLITSNDRKSPMAGATLWRKVNDPKLAPEFARLPEQLDVDITLNCSDYDAWPYSMGAGRRSFRDLLEGFTDPKDGDSITLPLPSGSASEVNINQTNTTVSVAPLIPGVLTVPVHMHNLVHSYFNGSWFDVATSPNDPIFFLHHTFVDKLFELWIRKNRPSPEQYPKTNCPPGHGAYSALVPFIPVTTNIDYFVDSRSLGYDYDNYLAGKTLVVPDEGVQPNLASSSTSATNMRVRNAPVIASVVLSALLLSSLIVIIILLASLVRQRQSRYIPIDSPHSTDHHLAAMDTWERAKYILPIRRYRTSVSEENARLLSPTK